MTSADRTYQSPLSAETFLEYDLSKLDLSELAQSILASTPEEPEIKTQKTKTTLYSAAISPDTANAAYDYLVENVLWEDGIYSKRAKQISRKAYMVGEEDTDINLFIYQLVEAAFESAKIKNKFHGIYVNYYQNGTDFCPSHSHPSTVQAVISLGAVRKLFVGKKEYPMKSGDMIVFGSSSHGIPKEPEIAEGRISIAVFMVKE